LKTKNAMFVGLLSLALAGTMVIASSWWSIRLQTSGGWLSSTGDPSTVLPALVIVFFLVAIPFFQVALGKYKPTMDIQRIILSVLIASVLTLSTGWLTTGETFTPGGTYWQSYGFPLPWRVEQKYGCPPWCLPNVTTYNLWFFLVDLASSLAFVFAFTPYAKPFSRHLANSLGVLSTGRRISISWRNNRKKFSVLTMIGLVALIGAESALLTTTTSASSCQLDCNGFGSLFIESFQVNSPINATIRIRNVGPSPMTLHSYTVQSSTGGTYTQASWSGPTIPVNTVVPVTILIDGKDFTFDWGGIYTLRITTAHATQYVQMGQLTFDAKFLDLPSPTDLRLTVSNTGWRMVVLASYQVVDPQGHQYNSTAWSGPTLGPGAKVSSDLTIDGTAFTFQHGKTYTIRLYNMTITEWTISVLP
jgi:hypothetical protein